MTRRSEEGAATVLALAVCAVVALAAAVLAGSGLAAVTRHRAALAADAAALAAASHSASGSAAACRLARRALEVNGARLRSCTVDGPYVVIGDLVPAPRWIAWAGTAAGEARSGPDADAEKTGGVASAS